MAAHVQQRAGLGGLMQQTQEPEVMRIGELLLLAGLWMIFGFMLWYYLSAFHGIPVRMVSEQVLRAVLGEQLLDIVPNPDRHYLLQVQTRIPFDFPDGSREQLGFIVNPLVYGYGLPLLFGLLMATSQPLWRKGLVLLSGYLVIGAVQVWGVTWESLKLLTFSFGPTAADAVAGTGISPELIALCYQLGALILPALAPVVLWLVGNRREVEAFIRT